MVESGKPCYVAMTDHEQLQQAHSKSVELAAQLAKQVGELTEERDVLLRDIEELRRGSTSLRDYADSQQRVCIQVMEERDSLAAYCEELSVIVRGYGLFLKICGQDELSSEVLELLNKSQKDYLK